MQIEIVFYLFQPLFSYHLNPLKTGKCCDNAHTVVSFDSLTTSNEEIISRNSEAFASKYLEVMSSSVHYTSGSINRTLKMCYPSPKDCVLGFSLSLPDVYNGKS